MSPSVLAIWAVSVLLALLGAAGVAGAVLLSAERLRAAAPEAGASGGLCPCCGYPTAGLEEDRCPECGRAFALAADVRERRRRRGLAGAGVAAMLLGGLGFPVSDAAQNGLAHALPTYLLIESLTWAPKWGDSPGVELRTRAESGTMRAWERRELAQVCNKILEGSFEPTPRRRASMLLTRVPEETGEARGAAMLRDADPAVRADGAMLFSRRAAAQVAVRTKLARLACDDRSPVVRKRAIDALRVLGDTGPEARRAFRHGLADTNDGVRRRALIAMASDPSDTGAAVGMAEVATQDRDQEIRDLAVCMLDMLTERQRALPRPGPAAGVMGLIGG